MDTSDNPVEIHLDFLSPTYSVQNFPRDLRYAFRKLKKEKRVLVMIIYGLPWVVRHWVVFVYLFTASLEEDEEDDESK